MGKIIFEKVDFHYPEIYTPVFEKVSICMDTQWRLGLIGRNGRGKTTLLRLMGGELSPTAGRIKKDVAVEYFPYHYSGDAEKTLDVIAPSSAHRRITYQILSPAHGLSVRFFRPPS